jgi:single-stranded-DNA-specific exonuclease
MMETRSALGKKWELKQIDPTLSKHLAEVLSIDETLAGLLSLRGVQTFEEAKAFFRPTLKQLHDPFLMHDMDKAATRLLSAIDKQESIMVYGDYDVDGTTSVAMVYRFLKELSPLVYFYIPDRYKEGYGLSEKGIKTAKDLGCSLLITLDCGIKAVELIHQANTLGLDTIICDHHTPGKVLPKATAILDPKKSNCTYPFKELCGCGVGFKLLEALAVLRNIPREKLYENLDFVAIATGADIVPLVGENRVLMHFGMKQITYNKRPGVEALLEVSGKKQVKTVTDVVFGIAPRINAAGRIKQASEAVHLLIQQDFESARRIASAIEHHNRTRRVLDTQITKEALEMIQSGKKYKERVSTVVFHPDWHKGVVGIVASRLIESYYRPTIVLAESNGVAVGSARSIAGFDIYEALDQCADTLIQFGGHKYAAGLTLKLDQVELFEERFDEVVRNTIDPELLIEKISIDLELGLEKIGPRFYRIMRQMAPFGPGNRTPVFVTKKVKDAGYSRSVGSDKSHLKLHVVGEDGIDMQGIAFGMGHMLDRVKSEKYFDIVYSLEENTYKGNITLQLLIRDLRFPD